MKTSMKVVTIIFTLIMGFFTVYQWAVGNPFQDEVNPTLATFIFFILGVLGIIAAFRKKK